MNILVTGATGFVGKNVTVSLEEAGHHVLPVTRETPQSMLEAYCHQADYVFHLAGVNRPETEAEFFEGNVGVTESLLSTLTACGNMAPVVLASSIQAEFDNAYGRSKLAAEETLLREREQTGRRVHIFRLPNLFGKWGRPNYNSVVATFCDRVATNRPIEIHDPNKTIELAYIDDVVEAFMNVMTSPAAIYRVVPVHEPVTLKRIAELLYSFRASRRELSVPNFDDLFVKQLYSTYLSYLPVDDFAYNLKKHEDDRGSFTEFIRTPDRGQVSVNVSKPGITKGNHWHHTKNEKFLIVSGEAMIHLRKVGEEAVQSFYVTGDMARVIDIPVGYTHSIENIGTVDLVTVIWVNEPFDPNRSDTYFMEVQDEATQSHDHRRDASGNHSAVIRHPKTRTV